MRGDSPEVRGNSAADLRLENLENRALSGKVTQVHADLRLENLENRALN